MHKVCDIRNTELRAGLSPREVWASYVRDLSLLMERAVGEGSVNDLSLNTERTEEQRRAA